MEESQRLQEHLNDQRIRNDSQALVEDHFRKVALPGLTK